MKVLPIILMGLAAVIAVSAVIVLYPQGEEKKDPIEDWSYVENAGTRYTIEYHPDGGRMTGEHQDYYYEGAYVALPECTKSGKFFQGWYKDPEFTIPIGAVNPFESGNLSLYASWADYSSVGKRFVADLTGYYYNGDIKHTVNGTTTYSVMTYRDDSVHRGSYYIMYEEKAHYHSDTGFDEDIETAGGFWEANMHGKNKMKYTGNEEIGGKTCQVWTDGTETRWIYRMSEMIRIIEETSTSYYERNLSSIEEFEPDTRVELQIDVEYPLTVTYPTNLHIGDSAVLRAEGKEFTSWLVNDIPSLGSTLQLRSVDPFTEIEARAGEYTALSSGDIDPKDFGLTEHVMIRGFHEHKETEMRGSFTLDKGYWHIRDADHNPCRYVEVFVDDYKTFDHSFTYNHHHYNIKLDMKQSEVFRNAYRDPWSSIRNVYNDEMLERMYVPSDPYIQYVHAELKHLGTGMDERHFAEFVLAFVQAIPYVSDGDTKSHTDYMKYPSETLWDYGGDCEDASILYATLMAIDGKKSCIMIYDNHAMAGVSIGEIQKNDHTFLYNHVRYLYAETTNSSWDLGQCPKGYGESAMRMVVCYPVDGS